MRLTLPTTLFLLIGLAAAGLPVQGATYYVTKSGNDSNGCTQAQPCLTITRGSKVATKAGDIVQVGPGTYSEKLTLTTSGSATGGKITFRGHDGSGCPTESSADINSRGVRPSPTVVVNGFIFSANYLAIDCFKIAGGNTGYYFNTSVTNIDVVDSYVVSGALADMQSGGNPNTTPQNIVVNRSYAAQGWIGLAIQCRNCSFEDNEIERPIGGGAVDGDYTHIFGANITLRNNYFHGASMTDCNANGGGCHIDCVQTWNIGGTDTVASNITLDRNTCFNFHEGIIARDTTHSSAWSHRDWTVTNNIFAHGPIGDGSPWCALFEHVANVNSYNNLCNDTAGYAYLEGSTGTHRNNIHVGGGNNPYGATSSGWGSGSIVASNNLLYQSGVTYSASTYANDVINKNPLFVNLSGDNYRLASGSPAIDKGMNVGILVDRIGAIRPQGAGFDIGPYEFGASSGAPAPPSTLLTTVN